jgi:hypothetical protein
MPNSPAGLRSQQPIIIQSVLPTDSDLALLEIQEIEGDIAHQHIQDRTRAIVLFIQRSIRMDFR